MTKQLEINQLRKKDKPLWRVTANTIEPGEYSAVIQMRGDLKKVLDQDLLKSLRCDLDNIIFELMDNYETDNPGK